MFLEVIQTYCDIPCIVIQPKNIVILDLPHRPALLHTSGITVTWSIICEAHETDTDMGYVICVSGPVRSKQTVLLSVNKILL